MTPIKPFHFEPVFEDDLEDLFQHWLRFSARYAIPRAIVAEVDLALIHVTRGLLISSLLSRDEDRSS